MATVKAPREALRAAKSNDSSPPEAGGRDDDDDDVELAVLRSSALWLAVPKGSSSSVTLELKRFSSRTWRIISCANSSVPFEMTSSPPAMDVMTRVSITLPRSSMFRSEDDDDELKGPLTLDFDLGGTYLCEMRTLTGGH